MFWSLVSQVCPVSGTTHEYSHLICHIQDKCWSLYVGRDQGIRAPHYDVPHPQPDARMDSTPWIWTFDQDKSPYEQPSNLSRAFVSQVGLMTIACDIMDVVYGMKSSSRRGGLNLGRVADLQ